MDKEDIKYRDKHKDKDREKSEGRGTDRLGKKDKNE